MKTTNDEIIFEKNAAAPSDSRKRVNLYALQQEMKRWERHKTSPLQNYALVRIYLGMSEYLTPDGVYLMSQFTTLARKLGFRQPLSLLTALCQTHSFTFICNSELTFCYGFYSPLTLEGKKLTRFEMDQPELCRISVHPLLTEFYNTLNFLGDEVAICTKNEDKELNDNEVGFQSGTQNAKKAVKSVFNKISEFRSIYTNYILVNNIYITSSVNNPPTEEARNAQLTQLSHFEPSEPPSAADPFAAAKAPAAKPNFGSANDYFHEMNQSEARRSLFLHPQRAAISKRYHLTLAESRFVLIHIVNDYLIPMFNQQSRFLTMSPVGRDSWLRNLTRSKYYLCELDHAYENAKAEIQAFRQQEAQQKCEDLRSNHPLSPHEWTSPKSGKRLYQDPVRGVIELPDEAAPRPTATSRWNPFTQQWIEPENNQK